VKADPAVQRRLLDLAEADAELNKIQHRRRSLPELDEISRAERDHRATKDALVSAQTAHGDLDAEVQRLESEIDQVRTREQRDRAVLDSGNPGSNKQVEGLNQELDALARRQGVLEDELLEVMERREAQETDLATTREQAEAAEAALADAQHRRDEALADLESDEAKRRAERDSLVAELPSDLLKLYERVREQRGVGAGPLQGSRCGACRIELDNAAMVEVREAASDDVVRCAECGAVLVRSGNAR